MARDRSIVVRLKAEVSDFQSKMGQASRSLSDFEREQAAMGGAATTTLGRMVQSAKINEREWTQVGRTMLGVGTAMAGIGVATLKTGIDYNAMRQRATQALSAVTGSTEVAATQMRRLDEYGKGSWLMRDSLIRAQTQMTGFGIETGKVIPYMDSLADAVAATGGSNQDFEELARLMGQIKSQGKITARELMQFGVRGVDAAQLIGDAMGKTAGQIRDEITAGTLDADAALDALAEGMSTKFEGASDAVRDTFDGAMDNLKAAWRDLSAAFASPLVDPEGGGLLVGWVNNIADALFGLQGVVEEMPSWMKTGTLAFGGLTTAATLTAGAFMVALPKYVQLRESIATLADTHPRMAKFSGGMVTFAGRLTRAAGVAATAAAAFGSLASVLKSGGMARETDNLAVSFRNLNDAGGSLRDMQLEDIFREMPTFLGASTIEAGSLGEALDRVMNPDATDKLGAAFVSLADIAAGVFGQEIPFYMKDYEEAVSSADETLSTMLQEGGAAAELATAMIRGLGLSTDELAKYLPHASDEMILLADAADGAAGAAGELDEATQAAQDRMAEWAEIMSGGASSFGTMLDAYAAVIEANEGLDASTKETMDSWITSMQEQARAVENWRDNVSTAVNQIADEVPAAGRDMHIAFVEEMAAAGEEGAAALQTFVDGTPEQRAELVAAWGGTGYDIEDEIGEVIVDIEADTAAAQEKAKAWSDNWALTTTDTKLSADTDLGKARANALMGDWKNTTTETFLSANPGPAVQVFDEETRSWKTTTTDTLLDLNPQQAIRVFNSETGDWRRTTTDTLLGMNPADAERVFGIKTTSWRDKLTMTKLGMNTSSADGTLAAFRARARQAISVRLQGIFGGKFEGGTVGGLHSGGTVPGLKAGGRVPGPRAGYDNVMWPLHSGGRVLGQPLEGGEYVVRSSQAARYAPQLEAMNRGTFPAGGGAVATSVSLSAADVQRIAVAVREGAAVGSERGSRAGFSGEGSRQLLLSRGGG